MSIKTNRLKAFGKFRLDAERRVLWFEERQVNLPLKEIEVLCALIEGRGELVTKDEILEKVWADSFVEESNLSRQIYRLRKTFKDFGERDLIENVPRRGYRFTGEVREVGNGEIVIEKHTQTRTLIEIEEGGKEEREKRRRGEEESLGSETDKQKNKQSSGKASSVSSSPFLLFSLSALLLAALIGVFVFSAYRNTSIKTPASEIKSIAVLPFRTIDGGEENKHQGLGLADVLITRLSGVKEITVRPTSAVLNFENQDTVGAGRALQTDAVLEGSIYRTNEMTRVTARLLKTSDGSVVWTGEFEKLRQDEIKLQSEIALQVAHALALNLSGGEKNALARRYTENADAFELYQKGKIEWNKRTGAGMAEAEKSFRIAIEKDPGFTLAYVGLADALAMNAARHDEMFVVAQKALELDPHLAEAYATRGFIKTFYKWEWQEAEAAFKKSIELNPNYATAHHWYAQVLTVQGRHEEAKTEMRRALEINPLSHNFLADLGQIYYFSREYREAEEYCRRALEIYPDFTFARAYLYEIYLKTGEYDRAVEVIIAGDKIASTYANQSAERQKLIEANLDEQRKIYREGGIKKFVESRTAETEDGFLCYVYAINYAFLGEREKALACLERAYASRAFLSAFVKADPVFDDLRDEPRYREILRKMNLL